MPTFFETLKLHQTSKANRVREIVKSSSTIWLDFEMRTNDVIPVLVGLLKGEEFSQVVFDPALQKAVEAKAAVVDSIKMMHFDEWSNNLFRECLKGSSLVGYASHEREIIQAHWGNQGLNCDNRLTYLDSNITRLLRIGKSSVLTEMKTKQKNVYDRVGLKEFLNHPHFGYKYPRHIRGYQPAKQIQRLREQNMRHLKYSDWSKGSKTAWTKLLTYNMHDVLGMKYLTSEAVFNRSKFVAAFNP